MGNNIQLLIQLYRTIYPEGSSAGADQAVAELQDADRRKQTDHVSSSRIMDQLVASIRQAVVNRTREATSSE